MTRRVESSTAAGKPLAPQLPRKESFEAVFKLWDKANKMAKPPVADLKMRDGDVYTGKGGVKAIQIALDGDELKKLTGRQYVPYGQIAVDDHKKQIYLQDYRGSMGPFPLPKGVSYASLTDPGPMPRPKNDYQRANGSLAKVVEAGMTDALLAGRTQFDFKNGKFVSPSGERMQHHYIDDHTSRIPGGALMVGKKEFWVEMIPGYSGDCLGPFPLPKGFDPKSLVRKAEPAPRRNRTTDDYSSGRGAGGVDSSRGFPDSIGRRGVVGGGSNYAWGGRGGNLWGGGVGGGGSGGGGGRGGGGGGS